VEPADVPEHVAVIADLDERPRHVLNLGLEIARVFEEIAQLKEHFGLHAAN
jgi:hypothetical protein